MKIDVTGGDVRLSERLRQKLVRHALLALSRFGPRVRRVTISLAEPVNPLGGVDQRCQMRAWLKESGEIHADAINGGFETAVARAAAQLAKRVGVALNGGAGHGADALPARRPSVVSPGRRIRAR